MKKLLLSQRLVEVQRWDDELKKYLPDNGALVTPTMEGNFIVMHHDGSMAVYPVHRIKFASMKDGLTALGLI